MARTPLGNRPRRFLDAIDLKAVKWIWQMTQAICESIAPSATPQPRSAPPVAFSIASTIRALTASISSSVRVRSVG